MTGPIAKFMFKNFPAAILHDDMLGVLQERVAEGHSISIGTDLESAWDMMI